MPVMDRNPSLGDGGSEDLPRTLRRERDAQQRAQQTQQQRLAMPAGPAPVALHDSGWAHDQAQPAVVTAFKVPFFRLMLFYIKAVFAAIPALILLCAMLWGISQVVTAYDPRLAKVQIIFNFPK